MNATELDSFVLKFKHIWRSGFDAHLDLECHAGQAWVGIRVRLGHEHGPHLLEFYLAQGTKTVQVDFFYFKFYIFLHK